MSKASNRLQHSTVKRLWRCLGRLFHAGSLTEAGQSAVIPRAQHSISRQDISPNALKVLYRLQSAGFQAYLVGGGVRDLLLGVTPKDFDVATNATPEEVYATFRNSRMIGRRFRLVHVFFKGETIEVSTFRGPAVREGQKTDLTVSDNVYGTMLQDAWRRDYTVNALYYNISDFSVVDYTGGLQDLKRKAIRMIGEPEARFHEDPVRLLRAIRLCAKLGFDVADETAQPLHRLSDLLQNVPQSRLFDETLKLFFEGNAYVTYQKLLETDYLRALFPETADFIKQSPDSPYVTLIELAMKATDTRFHQGQSLNPGFLLGVLLWPVVQARLEAHFQQHGKWFPALHAGIQETFATQLDTLFIPRRFTAMIRSMWVLQYHLERRRGKRIFHIAEQRFFRAAFDFLALRAQAGEPVQPLVDWWARFQACKHKARLNMIKALSRRH
jgi:poly(A) polymerase